LCEQNLAIRERLLSLDHPDTLASRHNLANAYWAAGRIGAAVTLHEQNLAGRERILGPDHADTLRSRNSLAHAYRGAGREAEARRLES
jgi:Tetratricopeptide repeat